MALPNTAKYFRNHVVVRLRLNPSPSSAKEADYVYDCFRGLCSGTLEFFNIEKGHPRLNLYSNSVNLIYNPKNEPSQLDPFTEELSSQNGKANVPEILEQQNTLVNRLRNICALPRYSYIENDERFFKGEYVATFKYSLKKSGLKYDKKFEISASSVESPFASISTEEDVQNVMTSLRHNFQKFHKIDRIDIRVGYKEVKALTQNLNNASIHKRRPK